ncbi:hypothetical protein SUGI_0776820 [Cryptomeria japonica]|nr:hypothetical protein SUGI_0776820 [Cryptomeria japonica]
MLHSSTSEVPFQLLLEINIVLVGFNGDGGYRYSLDARKLKEFMKQIFPSHHPACLEIALPLDIEHDLHYNVIPVGQPELIALKQAVKSAMVPAGSTRQNVYGKEVPLLEVEAKIIEPIFSKTLHLLVWW